MLEVNKEGEREQLLSERADIGKIEIISEKTEGDGSVIIEIVKEYGNRTAVGHYLD